MSELRDLLRQLPSADVPPSDVKDALFARAKRGAEGRIVRARRVRIAAVAGASLSLGLAAAYGLGALDAPRPEEVAARPMIEDALPPLAIDEARGARLAGRPLSGPVLEGDVLALEVEEGGTLALRRETDRLRIDGEGALTLHATAPLRVELRRGAVDVDGAFSIEGPSCSCRIDGHARVAIEESEGPDGAWSSTHVTMIAGSVEALPSSACVMTPLTLEAPLDDAVEAPLDEAPLEGVEPREVEVREAIAPEEAPEAAIDPAVLLAERVDRLAQAQALVARDPDAALAALRSLSAEWPDAPVEEEIEASIVEALIEGGHGDRSRAAAERLVARWGARHAPLLERARALP